MVITFRIRVSARPKAALPKLPVGNERLEVCTAELPPSVLHILLQYVPLVLIAHMANIRCKFLLLEKACHFCTPDPAKCVRVFSPTTPTAPLAAGTNRHQTLEARVARSPCCTLIPHACPSSLHQTLYCRSTLSHKRAKGERAGVISRSHAPYSPLSRSV